MSKSTVWVLTREINEYDQDGEYFERVFAQYPTHDQLFSSGIDMSEKEYAHLVKHNSRGPGYPHSWYLLSEEEVY